MGSQDLVAVCGEDGSRLTDLGLVLGMEPRHDDRRIGAVAAIAEHPLTRPLAAGVPVTLAPDDPGMFHTDLDAEYRLCHAEFGAGVAELAEIDAGD